MPHKNNSIDFSVILASTVHDMKNSLAMLLGSLTDITNQCNPNTCPSHNKFLNIQHETQRLNRELVILLTLYKMDQEQYFFNIDEIDITEYLEEIILEYKDLLQGYGIKITLECAPGLTGYFDRNLVSSVIKNVISNAYRYTNDNILLSAEMENDFLKISVIDNGPGYPQHMIIDGSIKPSGINISTGSTGLGLFFSEKVAVLHKSKNKIGYIQLNNCHDSTGGFFSIYLP